MASASGQPASARALTSMWRARWGTSSSRRPEIRFTTTAGRSEVAKTSPSSRPAIGRDSESRTTATLPAATIGATWVTRPRRLGVSGSIDADDSHRLGSREVEVARGDRVHGRGEGRELVGPAGVVHQPVDRRPHFGCAPRALVEPSSTQDRFERPRRGPRASPPCGRGSGLSGRRSSRPSPAAPRAPCAPRRAGPCANRGRCWRASAPWRRAPMS